MCLLWLLAFPAKILVGIMMLLQAPTAGTVFVAALGQRTLTTNHGLGRSFSTTSSFWGTTTRIRIVSSSSSPSSSIESITNGMLSFHHVTSSSTARPTRQRKRQWRRSFSSSALVMMPEGPEVRTIVDQLQQGVGKRLVDIQFLSGRYVKHGRPDGFAEFAKTMTPIQRQHSSSQPDAVDTIVEWNAKGKFIYLILDDGRQKQSDTINDDNPDFQRSIWITLGMTGQFLSERVHLLDPKYARWYIHLVDVSQHDEDDDDGSSTHPRDFKIYYHDQRNFGTVKFCLSAKELEAKLQSLGMDILDTERTTVDDFLERMSSTKQDVNICKFLMNQQKISGVGNYILSEALYRSKIDPFASIGELDELRRRQLFGELQAVATESYSSQGLTRPRVGTYRSMNGSSGTYAFQLQCYGRQTCVNGNPVIRETNGPHGRAIWYIEDQLFMSRNERDSDAVWNGDDDDNILNGGRQSLAASAPDDARQPKSGQAGIVDLLDGLTDPGWKNALKEATLTESFERLREFLKREQSDGVTIFPPREDIFQALNLCPLDQTKVVIIGQDPYHGFGQAHGLAFSVQHGVPAPPSLKNIIKETIDDVGVLPPSHGCLESWAKQGVLLLNTVLTVRSGEANSHKNRGWEDFSDAVVEAINKDEKPRVFLLWGRPAAQKAEAVDTSKHVVISTSHPSPLGATKTSSPFLGSRCFSRANDALVQMGVEPIDWQIR